MKPTAIKKISQVAALLTFISLLLPIIAFGATTIKSVDYSNNQVTASVYSDVYNSTYGDVYLYVYGTSSATGTPIASGHASVNGTTYLSTVVATGINVQSDVYLVASYNNVTSSVYTATYVSTGGGSSSGGGGGSTSGGGGSTSSGGTSSATLTSIAFSSDPYSVSVGSSVNASVYASYSDSTKVTVTPLAGLVSSNPAVATVDQTTGAITGVSVGASTLTAVYGDKTASATVTVTASTQNGSVPVWASSKTLTATNVSQDSLTLNWSGADSTTVSYNVYKGSSLLASSVTASPYNVTGLSDDTSYSFMIQAVNSFGTADGPTLTVSTEKKPSNSPSPTGGPGGGTTSTGNSVSADPSGNVDATALSNAFANSSEVSISVTGDSAQLPASALLDASKKDGASVTVTSSEGSYTLPLSVLNGLDAIAKTLGVNASDLTIKVTISKVSGDTATGLNSAAKSSGINLLADAVDFNVQAETKDGKTASIDYGNTYVSRTLNLNATVDTNNATGVLYDPATGTFSFVPSTFSGNTATLKRNGNSIYTVASFNKSFTDIGNHWAKADIQLLANKLVIDGMTDSTFAPESNITRGQFAALVVRALGLTTSAASNSTFKDVKSTDWYANAVNTAAQAGLVNGYEDGTFRADKQITREELAALVVRALNYAGVKTDITASQQAQLLAKFSDSDKIAWGQTEIASAINAGIINGLTDTTIGSDSNATRAQSATMLKRLLTKAGFIN